MGKRRLHTQRINREPRHRPEPLAVEETANTRQGFWICLGLLAAVFLAYGRVVGFDFISLDDPQYVTENPYVQAGLTAKSIPWAFGFSFGGGWFPLTWLSLMLDTQLFSVNSGWYHFTNLLMHAASTCLLFLLLREMTGTIWRSALAAFLFGLHPLHVESVAWICERKDVLSGLLCILTLMAYAGYAKRGGRGRYFLTWALFGAGLMAKSTLVTLPVIMLLLDRWPFKRGLKLLEKVPFLCSSLAVSAATFLVHRTAGALPSFEQVPTALRVENALISYVVYLWKMIWPTGLALFYSYSYTSKLALALLAGLFLSVATFFVMREFAKRPYLAVGWLWYVVMLLPVIGFIQAGASARADRFTYLPMIGISVSLIWAVADSLNEFPTIRRAATVLAAAACLLLTWVQVGYWRDSTTAYQHAIDVTENNYLAHYNLAAVLEKSGHSDEAIKQLRDTVQIRPSYAAAHAELGQLLAKQGQPDAGLVELQRAVSLNPNDADTLFRMGSVLGSLGRTGDAAAEFLRVVQLQPENADAHYNLGISLAEAGHLHEAESQFQTTSELRPADADAHFNFGVVLAKSGRTDQAIQQLSEALRIRPGFLEARQVLIDLKRIRAAQ